MNLVKLLTLIVVPIVLNMGIAHSQQRVDFDLVIVSRSDISDGDQRRLFLEGVNRLPEVDSRLRVRRMRIVPDYVKKNDFSQYVNRLFDWIHWSHRNGFRNHKRHIHFLLPPIKLNGVSFSGGVAGAVCTTTRNLSRKYSYSIMRLANDEGLDRREHSRITALHEVLHNLGSNHVDGTNVMHPAALSIIGAGRLPIADATKRQVDNCRRGLPIYSRRALTNVIAEPLFD